MAKYRIDGVLYNISDDMDINETVAQIRATKSHFESSTKATTKGLGESLAENTAGAITAAGDLIAGAPGWVGSLPYAAYEAISTGDPQRGLKASQEITDELNPLSTNFRFGPLPKVEELQPSRETGGYENVMKVPEAILEAPGKYAGAAAYYAGAEPETIEKVGGTADLATMGLMGFGLARGAVKAGSKLAKLPTERKAAELRYQEEQKLREEIDRQTAEHRAWSEKLNEQSQRDWVVEQQAQEMGPTRDVTPPPRGPQRDFWEGEQPAPEGAWTDNQILGPMAETMARQVQERGIPLEREPGTGIYQAEPSSGRPTMRPEALQGPEQPGLGVPQGGLPYPAPEAARTFQNQHQPYGAYSTTQPRVPKARPAPLEMPDAGAPATRVPGFQRDALQVMEARAIQEAVQAGIEKSGRAGPELGGVGKRGFRQGGAIDPSFYKIVDRLSRTFRGIKEADPVAIKELNRLEQDIVQAEGALNRARVLRGSKNTELRQPMDRDPLNNGKLFSALDWAVFLEDAKWLRSAYKGEGLDNGFLNPYTTKDYRFKVAEKYGLERDYHKENFVSKLPLASKKLGGTGKKGFRQGGAVSLAEKHQLQIGRAEDAPSPLLPGMRFFVDGGPRGMLEQFATLKEAQKWMEEEAKSIEQYTARVPHGPGAKQGGGWTPFARKEEAPHLKDYREHLKRLGIENVPPKVLKRAWEMKQEKPALPPVSTPLEQRVDVMPDAVRMQPEIREMFFDQRSIETLGKDVKSYAEKGGRDVVYRGGFQKYHTAQKHPTTRAVFSRMSEILDKNRQWKETLVMGDQIKGTKRTTAPDSMHGLWNQLGRESQINVSKLISEFADRAENFNRDTARQIIGRDILPQEEASYLSFKNLSKAGLEIFNEKRALDGLPPIPERPGYILPALWPGEYTYFVRDAATGTLLKDGVVGSRFPPHSIMGRRFQKHLRRKLAKNGVDVTVDFVRNMTPEDISMSGIEAILEHKSNRYSEQSQLLRQAVRDVLDDIDAARARGRERKGHTGYRGSSGDWRGAKETADLINTYTNSLAHIKNNIELRKLLSEVVGNKDLDAHPMAKASAIKMIEEAMGKPWHKVFNMLDRVAEDSLQSLGLPPRFLHDVAGGMSNLSVRMLIGLFHLPQFVYNFFQHTQAFPKIMSILSQSKNIGPADYTTILTKSIVKGYYDAIRRPKFFEDLVREGTFASTMAMEFGGFGTKTFSWSKFDRIHRKPDLQLLAGYERVMVRAPAAAMFYHLATELGLRGKERLRVTKGLTDSYMVPQERWAKPAWVSNTGVVGQILGKLQSYPTSWLAQFMEYAGDAAAGRTFLPFATFVGLSVMLTGLTGQLTVREADAFISWMNLKFGTQVPTATETIMKHAPDMDSLRYGALSAWSGIHFGGGLAAPSPGVFAPGLSLAKGMWDVGSELLSKDKTKEGRREALKGVLPRSLHGFLEEPGNIVSRTFGTGRTTEKYLDPRQQGVIERNAKDILSRYLGTFSLREAKEKKEAWVGEQHSKLLASQRTKFYQSVTSAILDGKTITKEQLDRAAELEITSYKDLAQALKRHIEAAYLTKKQRGLKGLSTIRQQRLYQFYQQLGAIDYNNESFGETQ